MGCANLPLNRDAGLPVEARQPKPESLLLNEISLLGAIAFVEAVLTVAVSVTFLKGKCFQV